MFKKTKQNSILLYNLYGDLYNNHWQTPQLSVKYVGELLLFVCGMNGKLTTTDLAAQLLTLFIKSCVDTDKTALYTHAATFNQLFYLSQKPNRM